MAALAPRSSTSSRRAVKLFIPAVRRAAESRLKPSSTSACPSRIQTAIGVSCPQRRNERTISSSASGLAQAIPTIALADLLQR